MKASKEKSVAPEISIIIPVVERHDDLIQLFSEYSQQIEEMETSVEFIFVVDQRQRSTIPTLRALQAQSDHEIILILLGGTFGESSALTVGLEQAGGSIIATVAAYFQVEPSGLKRAMELLDDGADLIVGRRDRSVDSWFNRLQSGVFHWLVNRLASQHFHDISCGFRVMKREVAEELNVYGGLHRFIPILAVNAGFQVTELLLPQRIEDSKPRFHGLALYLKRVLDILTIFFLMKFTRRPLRFFGLIGLVLSALGAALTGYLGLYRLLQIGAIADRPLLLLGVLLMVLGVQTLSIGLLGEIIIFTHAREIREYRIQEVIRRSRAREDQLAAARLASG